MFMGKKQNAKQDIINTAVTTNGTVVNVGSPDQYNATRDGFLYYKNGGVYSLETHLEICAQNEYYKRLVSNWYESKGKWTRMLKEVDPSFPQYSSHDHEHSDKIIEYIEMLLGPSRIAMLSPTDTWLILQCSYTHDLGMCVKGDEKDKLFKKAQNDKNLAKELLKDTDYKEYLFDIIHKEYYPYSGGFSLEQKSTVFWAKRYEEMCDEVYGTDIFSDDFSVARYYYDLIISNWFRKKHAERSAGKIIEEAAKNDSGDLFSGRLSSIIAEIVEKHTNDWTSIYELDYQQKGIYTDHIHPQFIAALIRMGDLLDLDTNRFNSFRINSLAYIVPESAAHMLKHDAVSSLNVSDDKICVTARFRTNNVKKFIKEHKIGIKIDENSTADENTVDIDDRTKKLLLRAIKTTWNWMDWIKKDAREFSLAWRDIAPKGMYGTIASADTLEIYLDNKKIDNKDFEIKYEISHARSAHIIEGAGLYESPFVFLREIIQNAIDATKRQLFRIVNNNYGEKYLKSYLEFVKNFVSLIEQHKIYVNFIFKKDKNGLPLVLKVEVIDRGIGITRKRLGKMKHIGDIVDKEQQEEYEKMPEWIRPTNDFGIGMQSVFLVTDKFWAETTPSEQEEDHIISRRITFHSTLLGGDIINDESVSNKENGTINGTKIIIMIDLTKKSPFMFKMLYDIYKGRQDYGEFSEHRLHIQNELIKAIKSYIEKTFIYEIIPIEIDYIEEDEHHETQNNCISNEKIDINNKNDEYLVPFIYKNIIYEDSNILISENGDIFYWYASETEDSINIFLRFNNKKSTNPQTSLYFRGIYFDDKNDKSISDLIYTPDLDCKINIMNGYAEKTIEINRERIKDEYYPKFRENLSNCFKSFYIEFISIFNTMIKNNDSSWNKIKNIIMSSELVAKYFVTVCYLLKQKNNTNKLIEWLQENGGNQISGVFIDHECGTASYGYNTFRYYVRDIVSTSNETPYFINMSDDLIGQEIALHEYEKISIFRESKKPPFYAMKNMFFDTIYLNYKEVIAFSPENKNQDLIRIFRVTEESEEFPEIDDPSYYLIIQAIIRMTHKRLQDKQITEDYHPLFPAPKPNNEDFRNICVGCPPASASKFEIDMYNKWIISPFPISDYFNYDISNNRNISLFKDNNQIYKLNIPQILLVFVEKNIPNNKSNYSFKKRNSHQIKKDYKKFMEYLEELHIKFNS